MRREHATGLMQHATGRCSCRTRGIASRGMPASTRLNIRAELRAVVHALLPLLLRSQWLLLAADKLFRIHLTGVCKVGAAITNVSGRLTLCWGAGAMPGPMTALIRGAGRRMLVGAVGSGMAGVVLLRTMPPGCRAVSRAVRCSICVIPACVHCCAGRPSRFLSSTMQLRCQPPMLAHQ